MLGVKSNEQMEKTAQARRIWKADWKKARAGEARAGELVRRLCALAAGGVVLTADELAEVTEIVRRYGQQKGRDVTYYFELMTGRR